MNQDITQTTLRIAPPLGDLATRDLACWLAAYLFTQECAPGLVELMCQRGATLAEVQTELRRRETLGVGVR